VEFQLYHLLLAILGCMYLMEVAALWWKNRLSGENWTHPQDCKRNHNVPQVTIALDTDINGLVEHQSKSWGSDAGSCSI